MSLYKRPLNFFCDLLMKLIVSLLILCASPVFSAGGTSVSIAFIEEIGSLEGVPFAGRVEILGESEMTPDEEEADHGLRVASIFVGEGSPLPKDVSVTCISSVFDLPRYVSAQPKDTLTLINWSGILGCPYIPQELEDEFLSILSSFNGALSSSSKKESLLRKYNELLRDTDPGAEIVTGIISVAKGFLESASEPSEHQKREWNTKLSEMIQASKDQFSQNFRKVFERMKSALLRTLETHDNTLILWALGNEVECIDMDPFWTEILSDECILNHVVLVSGTVGNASNLNIASSYTKNYAAHAVARTLSVPVYHPRQDHLYFKEEGTSFSAPLVTLDAYKIAQGMDVPTHQSVKDALLRAQSPQYAEISIIPVDDSNSGSDEF